MNSADYEHIPSYRLERGNTIGELCTRDEVSGEWVSKMFFAHDINAVCLRLEAGIPALLAEVIPANMEVVKVGDNGEPLFIVRQIIACGTVSDIINQISELQSQTDL